MRLSVEGTSGGPHGVAARSTGIRHHVAAVMATLILLATMGAAFATFAKPARADTVFTSGKLFVSYGFGDVDVYDTGSDGLLTSLVDSTGSQFTAGSAFAPSTSADAGNIFVADGSTGDISEFDSLGNPLPTFASGLANPAALVFDNAGNLYVGQVRSPYIAEFSPTGQRMPDIGPLKTELFGADWIDLSSDQCTFYYTSERTDIMRYNMCTNTQLPDFNVAPLTGAAAFELRILPSGNVLVADSSAVVELDPNGNVIQTYQCSDLPGCSARPAASSSPSPSTRAATSFWTGDVNTGDVWQVDIATGQVMQTMYNVSAYLYGLSVDGEATAATSDTTVPATPTSLVIQPVSGNFSSPTPVSAVLTDSSTDTPIPGEPITFTLNGTDSCTSAPTDSSGIATCVITPGEPSGSYTLTASFPGDTSQPTEIATTTASTTFTVSPDDTVLTYTGPTTAVNGEPTTLSGTLTTDTPTPGTPVTNQVVTFTIGSQSCDNTTQADGTVSCTIPVVDQPVSNVTVTSTFTSDNVYDSSTSSTTPMTVTQPTTLTVHSATSDYADVTQVSGTLTDPVHNNAPISGETVTLSLDGNESCSAQTNASGLASCPLTPSEAAGTYPLTGNFAGNPNLPLQLTGSTGASQFVVTPEETALTYTGATIAQNGQPLHVSGVLTTDDPGAGAPISGKPVTFTLGSGSTAQTCTATTDATGLASCNIASVSQSPGPIPVTDLFAGDGFYQTASAASTVNLPEGTKVTVTQSGPGTYDVPTTVSATLDNTYTNLPVPGEPVTLLVNGTTQSCTAVTDASGVATCSITPNEPAGTYSLTTSFPGDSTSMPQLTPSTTSSTFTVLPAPTTVTVTPPPSVTNGQPTTLSGVLTETDTGTDVPGRTVTFTIGSQSCTGTTNASGAASCTIPSVNQTAGTVVVVPSFGGDNFYTTSTNTSPPIPVYTPTRLTVNPGSSDFSDTGTVSAVLTNATNGAAIAGETVTLTLYGTQTCTAVTNALGVASCSVTPNEPAGTYALDGDVRRRHVEGARAAGPAVDQRIGHLHRGARGDHHHLHRAVTRGDRPAVHHVGQPHPRLHSG